MNLEIANGQKNFYQWDTGRYLLVLDDADSGEVHYAIPGSSEAFVCRITEQNGERRAPVPDVLLQTEGMLTAYLFTHMANGTQTRLSRTFPILRRPRPSDYVYTDDQIRTWDMLTARVEKLETTLEDPNVSIRLLIEEDMLPAVYDAVGRILTDENSNVILRY